MTLLADLERATDGSRDLSDQVLLAAGWRVERPRDCGVKDQSGDCFGCGNKVPAKGECAVPQSNWNWTPRNRPNVTENLQDALLLVPEGWSYQIIGPDPLLERGQPHCILGLPGTHEVVARGATSPLALCIASLRAIAAEKERAA